MPGSWIEAGFLPRSRTLAMGGGSAQTGQYLELWDLTDPGRPVAISMPCAGADNIIRSSVILDFASSPDGHLLAAMDGYTDALSVWDVSNPKRPELRDRIIANQGTPSQSPMISFDGPNVLDIGESDGTETVWDFSHPGSGHQTATLTPNRLGGPFNSQTSAGTCAVAAVVTDYANIRLFSDRDPRHPMPAAKLVTNTTTQATGFNALALTDWCLLALDHPSTDGDDQIELWNVTDPYHPRKLATMASGGTINSLDVSSDGERLAVTVDIPNDPVLAGRQVKVWSLDNTAAPAFLERFPGDGPVVLFAGHDLVYQGVDEGGSVYSTPLVTELVQTDPDAVYQALCQRTPTTLTPMRWTQLLPDINYQLPCP
jgi:WD40 repeat protein